MCVLFDFEMLGMYGVELVCELCVCEGFDLVLIFVIGWLDVE